MNHQKNEVLSAGTSSDRNTGAGGLPKSRSPLSRMSRALSQFRDDPSSIDIHEVLLDLFVECEEGLGAECPDLVERPALLRARAKICREAAGLPALTIRDAACKLALSERAEAAMDEAACRPGPIRRALLDDLAKMAGAPEIAAKPKAQS